MGFRAGRVVAWVCAGVGVFGIVGLFVLWVGSPRCQGDIDQLSVAPGEQHDVGAALYFDVARLCVGVQALRKALGGVGLVGIKVEYLELAFVAGWLFAFFRFWNELG